MSFRGGALARPPGTATQAGVGRVLSWAAWPAVLIALAFAPLVALHAWSLWNRPHYQFFPALLPGALVLAWRSCRELGPLEPNRSRATRPVAVALWLLLGLSVLLVSPLGGSIAALLAVMTAAYALGGRRLAVALLPAWLFLWLAIPLPRHYDDALIASLQRLVSRLSSGLLDLVRVDHVMEGNVVEVSGRRLLVDQACSGVYSLLTLVMATLFYVLWTRADWLKGAVLLAAAVFWVIAGNVVRVVAAVALTVKLGVDATRGWRHEFLGLVVFAGMVAMIASTGSFYTYWASVARVMRFVLYGTRRRLRRAWRGELHKPRRRRSQAPDDDAPLVPDADKSPAVASPAGLRDTWLGSPVFGVAFGLLLLPQSVMPGVDWRVVLSGRAYYEKAFATLGEDAAPEQVGDLRRVSFGTESRTWDNTWGEFTRYWAYRGRNGSALAALDYTFVGWHDLLLCYKGQGWRVGGDPAVEVGDDGVPAVTADFMNLEGRYGHLVYGLFNRQGRYQVAPDRRGLREAVADRLAAWTGRSDTQVAAAMTYQIQVLFESTSPAQPADKQAAHALFDQLRQAVARRALGVGSSPP
jgi:exosortase